jgi:hypothetical protein
VRILALKQGLEDAHRASGGLDEYPVVFFAPDRKVYIVDNSFAIGKLAGVSYRYEAKLREVRLGVFGSVYDAVTLELLYDPRKIETD